MTLNERMKEVTNKIDERQKQLMAELKEKIFNNEASICDYVFTGNMLSRLQTFKDAYDEFNYGRFSDRHVSTTINVSEFIEYIENGVFDLR